MTIGVRREWSNVSVLLTPSNDSIGMALVIDRVEYF